MRPGVQRKVICEAVLRKDRTAVPWRGSLLLPWGRLRDLGHGGWAPGLIHTWRNWTRPQQPGLTPTPGLGGSRNGVFWGPDEGQADRQTDEGQMEWS